MKRILHWLTVKLSGTTPTGATEERNINKEHLPNEHVKSSESRAIDDDLKSNVYAEANDDIHDDDNTQPDLEIIDNPLSTSEMSEGVDPYNSSGFKIPKN